MPMKYFWSFIRFIVLALLFIFIGYWLGNSQILAGTSVNDVALKATGVMPQQTARLDYADQSQAATDQSEDQAADESSQDLPPQNNPEQISPEDVDYQIIEDEIFRLVNELRAEKGVQPVTKNEVLTAAANKRAVESAVSFSHTRPNGTSTFTIFTEEEYYYPYRFVGENLGMATYLYDEEIMARFLFNGWKESQGHYETMINGDFEEIGIGVYYNDGNIYATQFFGTSAG